jgi:hypothetical protein
MVTNIGNTTASINIADAATYVWYICGDAMGRWPMAFIDGSYEAAPSGVSVGSKAYKKDIVIQLRNIKVLGLTEWQNLCKALSLWESNNAVLTLTVKNEFGGATSLAQFGSYGSPTTLVAMVGRVVNFNFTVEANVITCSVDFTFIS